MHPRPSARTPSLLLAVAAVAIFPPAADAGDRVAATARGACETLVTSLTRKLERSRVVELQGRVQAHRITGAMLGALGQKFGLGARWVEGNPFWEEAYTLFHPDMYANMKLGGEREVRYMEANLPRALDPATCKKHLALLSSRAGATAARIEDALSSRGFLAEFEKAFGIPARLQPLADEARREIREGTALLDDPEVLRAEPSVPEARKAVRAYDEKYAAAVKRLGGPDPAEQRKASQEAGVKMMARHKDALSDIVRRFRAAEGK